MLVDCGSKSAFQAQKKDFFPINLNPEIEIDAAKLTNALYRNALKKFLGYNCWRACVMFLLVISLVNYMFSEIEINIDFVRTSNGPSTEK